MDYSSLNILVYYCALISLLLQCFKSFRVLITNLIHLIRFDRIEHRNEVSHLSIFVEGTEALIILLAGVILIWILQTDVLSPWFPLLLGILFTGLELLIEYFHKPRTIAAGEKEKMQTEKTM